MKAPYPEKPCPVPPEELENMYIDWKTITQNYDLNVVKDILDLWKKKGDKRGVAKMINSGLFILSLRSLPGDNQYFEIMKFMKEMTGEDELKIGDSMICAEPTLEEQRLQEELEQMKKEKVTLLGRIEELEDENKRLSTLLNKKKTKGEARKFTLVEIVNYCKKRVRWEDVNDFVAMLNRLLRSNATEEDSELVDSVEEHFMNKSNANVYFELVNKKEMNIDKNYGPNIENHNGGMIGLPDKLLEGK